MWVICSGVNRSGSTWQYQLVTALVEAAGVGHGLGYVSAGEFRSLARQVPQHDQLLVVKCHDYSQPAGDMLASGQARAVHIHRDIRDAAISYMNFRSVSFASMLARRFIEMAIRNDQRWQRNANLHVARYETAIDDVAEELRRISSFLEIEVSQKTIQSIASEHSLGKNKKKLDAGIQSFADAPSTSAKFDQKSLMHPGHISSGKSGQWQSKLSRFQLAVIEYICADWMRERDYPFSQSASRRALAGLLTLPFRKFAGTSVSCLRQIRHLLADRTVEHRVRDLIKSVEQSRTKCVPRQAA